MAETTKTQETRTYEAVKPIRMYRVRPGDALTLTEAAARPLIAAGWIKTTAAAPKTATKKDKA